MPKRLGRPGRLVVHRASGGDAHGARLSESILVGTQVYKLPPILLAFGNEILDMLFGVLVARVLLTVRQDDDGRWGCTGPRLDRPTNGVQERRRPSRLVRLTGQGLDLADGSLIISDGVLVVKLNESHGASKRSLLLDERVVPTDGVVPARLHGARAIEEEDTVGHYGFFGCIL